MSQSFSQYKLIVANSNHSLQEASFDYHSGNNRSLSQIPTFFSKLKKEFLKLYEKKQQLQQYITSSDSPTLLTKSNKDTNQQSAVVAYHASYTNYSTRLASFEHWPTSMSQKPCDLARAGFFYYGVKDRVKCFHCNGGLENWEWNEDAFVSHVRWFPNCHYMHQLMGPKFIQQTYEAALSREKFILNIKSMNLTGPITDQPNGDLVIFNLPKFITPEKLENIIRMKEGIRPASVRILREQLQQQHTNGGELCWFVTLNANDKPTLSLIVKNLNRQLKEDFSDPLINVYEWSEIKHQQQEQKKNEQPKLQIKCGEEKSMVDVKEELERLKRERLCVVCLDVEKNVVFLPCGHLAVCLSCSTQPFKHCPVCRSIIQTTVRTFV